MDWQAPCGSRRDRRHCMGRVHADAAFARPALPPAGDVASARRRCDGPAGTDATRIGDRPARLACRYGVSGPACLGVPPGRPARGFWTSWRRPRRLGAAACDRDFVTWQQMARRASGGSTALHAADVDAGRRPGRIAPFAHAGNPRLIVPTASSATSCVVRPGSSRHYMTGGGARRCRHLWHPCAAIASRPLTCCCQTRTAAAGLQPQLRPAGAVLRRVRPPSPPI